MQKLRRELSLLSIPNAFYGECTQRKGRARVLLESVSYLKDIYLAENQI